METLKMKRKLSLLTTMENKMRHRRALKAIAYALLPIAFFLIIRFGFGIMILTNQTNSLPYTFFIYNSKANPSAFKPGDLIMFEHRASKLPIIKKVIGIEGDQISKTTDTVMIRNIVLPLKATDSKGNLMKVIQANRVETGYVFVSGSHLNSFDSRYEKFGLVSTDQIKGVVWPIF